MTQKDPTQQQICPQHTASQVQMATIEASTKSSHHRLDEHQKRLDGHEEQIEALTTASARQAAQSESLCKQMGQLTTAIWGLILTWLTTLTTFFIWFVQTGGGTK